MPDDLEPEWVGRRISVRRVLSRTDEGREQYGDVVGELVDLAHDRAVIEQRGELVIVARDTVAVARLVPPSTAEELALEAVVARGWPPAETGAVGGWVLRADAGFTKRANSVLPLKAPGQPVAEAIAQARAWYAERGLPLLFSVPTESRRLLDADLGERGFVPELEALVLTARLPDTVEPPEGVELADRPDDAWLARWERSREAPDVARAILLRPDTVAFASVRVDGRTVAVGRGVVDDGWVGLHALEVAPEHRRRGFGRAIVAALWAWGRSRDAQQSYLQVERDSTEALGLYESLGYRAHHAYRYRRDPGNQADPS